jgi:hypothetical protein
VNISADLVAPCSPGELFDWVDDLSKYPQWMGLVHRGDPQGNDHLGRPAWDVELRARIGPFARSKRLTMVRSVCRPNEAPNDLAPSEVVFERAENDERKHSVWRLSANVTLTPTGSRLSMELHYGGGLWAGGLVERALHDEIDASRERLLKLIGSPTQ